jgi:crossover junction endodeoxyribonuclease RusA
MTSSKPSPDKLALPWPPRALSPNSRDHWAVVSGAKKRYRLACFMLAKQMDWAFPEEGPIHLDIEFVPPNKRAHDLDNCSGCDKSWSGWGCGRLGGQ